MAPTTTSGTWAGAVRPSRTGRTIVRPQPGPGGARGGFTFVEILLALALLALLAGTFVMSMGSWFRTQAVAESARRVEGIFRLARAEACNQGRRFRLTFDPDTLAPAIVWEPRPLEEPGIFLPFYGAWAHDLPTDVLRFQQCRRVGDSARKLLTYSDSEEPVSTDGLPLETLTFLPDGSCDSAVVEVVALDGQDERVGRIELDGLTGAVKLRLLTPTEQQEQQALDAEAEAASQ